MQWFVRVSSQAAIVNGIASAISYYWRPANRGPGQALVVSSITLLIGYWHTRGIRESAWAIRFFTIGKLVPVLLFVTSGMVLIDWRRLWSFPTVSPHQAMTAGLMLVFAYGGFETIPVIAGEAKDPRRDLLFALIATILCVTIVMSLAQVVYVASLPGFTNTDTPLADSARALLGWAGAAVISTGALISMLGNNAGSSLSASRILFAFAENGDVPKVFARISARHRTPAVAIWFSTGVTLFLAITGSFTLIAGVSALARLVTYTGVSAATLVLRNSRFPRAVFVLPFGVAIPVAAAAISLATVAGATSDQLKAGALAVAAGAAFNVCNTRAYGQGVSQSESEQ
jgi:amino acid transporter